MSFHNSRRKFTSSLHSRTPSLYSPPRPSPSSPLSSLPPETEQNVRQSEKDETFGSFWTFISTVSFPSSLKACKKEAKFKKRRNIRDCLRLKANPDIKNWNCPYLLFLLGLGLITRHWTRLGLHTFLSFLCYLPSVYSLLPEAEREEKVQLFLSSNSDIQKNIHQERQSSPRHPPQST